MNENLELSNSSCFSFNLKQTSLMFVKQTSLTNDLTVVNS